MKNILPPIVLIAFSLLSQCAQCPAATSREQYIKNLSYSDISKTIDHMRLELKDAQASVAATQLQLTNAQSQTAAVQKTADALQADRDWFKKNYQSDEIKIAKQDKEIKGLHSWLDKLGLALATAAAAAVFLFFANIVPAPFKLTPYYWYVRAAVTAATWIAVFALVRYIKP